LSFYDKNCCVYRLTNILLYWYNTTGWLLSKTENFNWTTHFEVRRSQKQRKMKEGTLLMLVLVLKCLCC